MTSSPPVTSARRPPPEEEEVVVERVGDTRFAVFVATSLNTHLALDVPLSDTVADLKKNLMIAHSASFPSLGEINVDAVKVKRRSHFYFLHDSMLMHTVLIRTRNYLHIFVDASASVEHLEEGGIRYCAKVSNGEEDNEADGVRLKEDCDGRRTNIMGRDMMDMPSGEEAFVKGACSLGPRETDDKETRIEEEPENVSIAADQARVVDASHASGFQKNDSKQGEINGEFIRDGVTRGAIGDVPLELVVAGVVGEKSSKKKRKNSNPKNKSSMKQQARGNESAALVPAEVVDGIEIEEKNARGTLSQKETSVAAQKAKIKGKREHDYTESVEKVGDASPSSVKAKKKSRKCISASAVFNPDAQEGERIEVVPGMNKNKASYKMELKKEKGKRRHLTAGHCSAAAENSPKPNLQPSFEEQDRGELSVRNDAGSDITKSPEGEEALKTPRRSSRIAASAQSQGKGTHGRPVVSTQENQANVEANRGK